MSYISGLLDLGKRAPKQLFYKGNWDKQIFAKCMAIVGSRRMTNYGQRVVEKIIPGLVQDGWTIVSGFMYGVDQAAHRAAMECGGKTIAVLGWGINYRILETRDLKLEEEIINSGGLIISEWEEQEPTLWTFPYRNRIVAAISREVIVVEAAAKSGSLITAQTARSLKRKVWAVPGPITSSVSAGTNNLIASGKAKMWVEQSGRVEEQESISDPILELVKNEPLQADEIARQLGKPVDEIGAQLSMFVLEGRIGEKDGKYYVG